MTRCTLSAGIALLLFGSSTSAARAQTTTATLEGTVRDATGSVLAGASIQVTGTRTDRTVPADDRGFYRVAPLEPATYTVTASHGGFTTRVLDGIVLPINRTVTLDIALAVAGRSETLTVAATPPLIDSTTSSLGDVIDARTIESIPLNGRNYLDLIQLLPGVIVNDTARADLGNRDTRGAILGERAGNTAFLIDGLENSDDFRGGVFQTFTQDAVQEFEVIEAGYKAEFGRGAGGVVNVITKSGANDVKGSGFFFLRNDSLDASNVENASPPELARYNSGFTLGGPITKDRSWFFGSLEHFNETRGVIFAPNIPDVLRVAEDFSRQPETHSIRPFGKYNRRVGRSNDLRGELSYTRHELKNELVSPTSLPSSSYNSITHTVLGSVALTSILGSHLFLEHSFSVRTQDFGQNQDLAEAGSFNVTFVDPGGGAFSFGPPIGSVQSLEQRYYTAREVVNLVRGSSHSGKAGVEFVRTAVDGVNGEGLLRVLVTSRALFAQNGGQSFQIPQGVAFINEGDELTRLRNNGVSLFAQDDWRLHPNLTLNLGVRYDYDSRFDDGNNVAPRLGIVWSPDAQTSVHASWGLFYDRYRLGIAQAVPEFGGFNGKTVVELDFPRLTADALFVNLAGSLTRVANTLGDPLFINRAFGIPTNAVVTASNVQSLTGLAPAQFLSALTVLLRSTGVAFLPVDFSPATGYLRQDLGAAFQDQVRVARPFETPYNSTVTVGVQRAFFTDWSVKTSYVHRRIKNILGVRIANLAFQSRTIGAAVTSDGGPLQRTYGPFYDGEYDAFILAVDKRFSDRYQFRASYIAASSTDNLLNSNLGLGIAAQGGGAVPTDNLDLEFDRGNSDLSVPHSFVASGVVQLPVNFFVSGVFRATGGVHFTASGPTLIDYDGDGISSRRPRGTRRNEFRGPKTANLDLRIEKRLVFGRYVASVLVESFNLTNARNPRLIDNFFVSGAAGPTFGEVLVPLPGRETQVGFRLTF